MNKRRKFRGLPKAPGRAGSASRIKMEDKVIIILFTFLVDLSSTDHMQEDHIDASV